MRRKVIERTQQLLEVLQEISELTYLGNPVLRQKTKKVSLEEGLKVGDELKRALLKYRDITRMGRGLAAPQIGENKTVFITYVDDIFTAYINPEITWRSEMTNCYREACISSGILWADVERSETIKISYTNERGETMQEKHDGFMARMLQHEYDHLQGIINLDIARTETIEIMQDPLKEELREC